MEDRIPDELLAKVEPEWKEDILKYVDGKDVHQEFLDHLDDCIPCNQFVNYVYKEAVRALEEVAKLLHQEREKRKAEELKNAGFLKRLLIRFLYWTGQ